MLTFFIVPPLQSAGPQQSPPIPGFSSSLITSPQSDAVSRASLTAARLLKFTPGSWAASLTLLEDSPQTYAIAQLIVSRTKPSYSSYANGKARASASFPPPKWDNEDDGYGYGYGYSSDKPSSSSRLPSKPKTSHGLSTGSTVTDRASDIFTSTSESKSSVILELSALTTAPLLPLSGTPPQDPARPFVYPGENDLSLKSKDKSRRLLREERRMAVSGSGNSGGGGQGAFPREPERGMLSSILFRPEPKVEVVTHQNVLVGGFEEPPRKGGESATELMYE
jgi:hypothetical protein